jgi:hypothetical protein
MLLENLGIGALMSGLTVCLHFLGLAGLIAGMRASFAQAWREGSALRRGAVILVTVIGLFGLHGVQIWLYAGLYLLLGEFPDIETALYFSCTTFTTVGYGDVLLSPERRLIAGIEGANGFILIGWSTAFLVSVTGKIGLLEARLEHSRPGQTRP